MTLTEAELEAKLAAVMAKAKAPLLEDLHTMTRALADEHRRVDIAIDGRHAAEADRNRLSAKMKLDDQERAGLQHQVFELHKENQQLKDLQK